MKVISAISLGRAYSDHNASFMRLAVTSSSKLSNEQLTIFGRKIGFQSLESLLEERGINLAG